MTGDEKKHIRDLAARYVCPGRVRMFDALGVDLVIGRRAGYRIWDVDGRELLDYHLNGGVFSLGHRNPEIVATLREALDTLDIGNHHFPSVCRPVSRALMRDVETIPTIRGDCSGTDPLVDRARVSVACTRRFAAPGHHVVEGLRGI